MSQASLKAQLNANIHEEKITVDERNKTIRFGDLEFKVHRCSIWGASLPLSYAKLLVDPATAIAAKTLLSNILNFTSDILIREFLFVKAVREGINAAQKFIDRYSGYTPTKKPQLYRDFWKNFSENTIKPAARRVAVVSTEFAIALTTSFQVSKLNLPLNLYCSADAYRTSLTEKEYQRLICRLEDFFFFSKKVASLERITNQRVAKILKAFLQNEEKGWKEYNNALKDINRRNKQNELYSILKSKKIFSVTGGYIIYLHGMLYYLTKNGELYRFSSWKTRLQKEFLYQAVTKNRINFNKLTDKISPEERRQLLTIIGQKRPDLAVVLAP